MLSSKQRVLRQAETFVHGEQRALAEPIARLSEQYACTAKPKRR